MLTVDPNAEGKHDMSLVKRVDMDTGEIITFDVDEG